MTIALVTLILVTQAFPTAGTSPSTPPLKRDYDCTDYQYQDNTSSGSPLVSDCQQLVSNIFGPGSWRTDQLSFRTIASYDACNFGVQQATPEIVIFVVGNQDVEFIINNCINAYQSGGRVGTSGNTQCNSDIKANNDVYWSLY
jgi:hypothetical protein